MLYTFENPIQVAFSWICWSSTPPCVAQHIFWVDYFFCECDSDGSNKRSRHDAINIWNSTSGEKGFMELYDTGRRRKSRKARFPWTASSFSQVNLYYYIVSSLRLLQQELCPFVYYLALTFFFFKK